MTTCPACASPHVVPLVHGKPGPGLLAAAERGEVALAGCVVVGEPVPTHACRGCAAAFTPPA